jgi:hypothetical protein
MAAPIGICTCGNHKIKGSLYNLINENSKEQLEKIMGSEFFNGKIPAPLYENILKSAKKKETILLESAASQFQQPLNELAVMLATKWNKRIITVKFLDRSANFEPLIIQYAKEWEEHANIEFKFVENEDADVRISLLQDGTSWSKLGKQCLLFTNQLEPTMNFGWFDEFTDITEIRRTTLHEFGHVLGCIHEHQSPDGNIPWDENVIRRVFTAGMGNSEEWVQTNILGKFPTADISNSNYDEYSIMHYPFDGMYTTSGRSYGVNWELSAQDKIFIKSCYPF